MEFLHIESISDVDNIDMLSNNQPVLIFKHSTRCATSFLASDRLRRSWKEEEMKNIKAFIINVINNRDLSNRIMNRYNIEHQSPQVLIISQGKCIYNNSHFGIDYNEIRDFILHRFGDQYQPKT